VRERVLRTVKTSCAKIFCDGCRMAAPFSGGVIGYEDTVMPQIINAVLARHNFILLGLRGQAKPRILRALTTPRRRYPDRGWERGERQSLRPHLRYSRLVMEEMGDDTPIAWVGRDQRFVEKLATPDVTIADIIGDVDPIKAARGGHLLSDELTIHYGMLPRANRGIFALNELPDLAGKVQVGLFNIMQEGDVQIKGYPVRLPLDVLLTFTANPEDYTARQDHHAPQGPHRERGDDALSGDGRNRDGDHGPGGVDGPRRRLARIPDFVAEVVERVAFEARTDKRVDRRSGVSQRLPISVMENVVSNAERRAVRLGESEVVPRLSDVYAALPAITGKIELEYEGELIGAATIARELIRRASDATFRERAGSVNADEIILWFEDGAALQVTDDLGAVALRKAFEMVPGLLQLVSHVGLAKTGDVPVETAACELVLESLVARRKISRSDGGEYARAAHEQRRRPNQDLFGGGLSA
jgi:magnesium chelatase subunit I